MQARERLTGLEKQHMMILMVTEVIDVSADDVAALRMEYSYFCGDDG
jgi:hypothetical protein